MMSQGVRVRFAPSPTGYPHVGNIRTALFNWLVARHWGGTFVVRIEDTDISRKVEGATEAILESLLWLGLDWDEGPEVGGDYGPYFQSRRRETYQEVARYLVKQGQAYWCYCSPQRLAEMRAEQVRQKQPPGYDRHCRELTAKQRAEYEAAGIIPVVRFTTPLKGQTRFNDLVRGEVVFENSALDDFILLKSDGYPTYHLANVVDDHLMEISHVLRADEWLASTPRHVLLYSALGYQPPVFAHLTMILGTDRAKLSKRHGATSVMEYREQGYLPEAVFNFLALLGWSLDDSTELLSREELIQHFSLERLSKAAAIFNMDKLNWMNGVYIRRLPLEDFVHRARPFLERGLALTAQQHISEEYLHQVLPLVQERTKTLAELPGLTGFFFGEDLDYDPQMLLSRSLSPDAALHLSVVAREKLQTLESWNPISLEGLLRPLAEELGVKTGEFFGLLRVATTGKTAAPPLFQTLTVLGKESCLRRLEAAIQRIRRLPAVRISL